MFRIGVKVNDPFFVLKYPAYKDEVLESRLAHPDT
jgi:hypothetical protein